MKKIEAYIRPEKLEDLRAEFESLHLNGVSISQIMGCGRQRGWKEYVRGTEIDYQFLPKIKLEIVVLEEQVEELIRRITSIAHTGEVGDGKIFLYDVLDAVRIRTKERGVKAIR